MKKRIGILGAMTCEIALLKSKMNIEKTVSLAGKDYDQGTIGHTEVVLACCGIGKVNAAMCAQTLIQQFDVTHVINTGVAGGVHEDAAVFDVILSNDVAYHDFPDLSILTESYPYQAFYAADKFLLQTLQNAYQQLAPKDFRLFVGRIVSGDIFVSDNALKAQIVKRFSPHCVDMESAAIGHVCFANNIPFVAIRSLSDSANDNAELTFEKFAAIAADHSATLLLQFFHLLDE